MINVKRRNTICAAGVLFKKRKMYKHHDLYKRICFYNKSLKEVTSSPPKVFFIKKDVQQIMFLMESHLLGEKYNRGNNIFAASASKNK